MNPDYPGKKKKELTNENALVGIRCPNCKQETEFTIHGRASLTVTDEGVTDTENHHWEGGTFVQCNNPNCKHSGDFAKFLAKNQPDDKE